MRRRRNVKSDSLDAEIHFAHLSWDVQLLPQRSSRIILIISRSLSPSHSLYLSLICFPRASSTS